jgi:hypothetical protein
MAIRASHCPSYFGIQLVHNLHDLTCNCDLTLLESKGKII